MLKYLSKIDMFGTPFYFNTPTGKTHYQTCIGGLTTVAVLSISFLYFLYVIIQWKFGLLLPRVSSSLVTSTYQEFNIKGEMLRIEIINQTGMVDPFSSTNNIITPLVVYMTEFNHSLPKAVFSEQVQDDPRRYVIIKDVELVQQVGEGDYPKKHQFMFLLFTPCSPAYLKPGQSCAPSSEIDEYIEKFAQVMKLSISVQQFDTATNTFSSIVKQSFMIFDNSLRLYSQLTLQYTSQENDEGMLMSNKKTSQFVSDYELFTQVVTKEYGRQYFGFDTLATFLIKLNDLRVEQKIVQMKITEILAQVGSMVSILLSVRALIEFVNNSLMRQDIIDQALKLQYPKFSALQIKRNIIGSIIEVKKNERKLDLALFKYHYGLAEGKMFQKFTITNILGSVNTYQQKKQPSLDVEDIEDLYQTKVAPVSLKSPPSDEIENIFHCYNSRED